MKKDKEWLREEVYKLIEGYTSFGGHEHTFITGENVNKLGVLIDQLDEPEVLSQEWIDENEEQEEMYGSYGVPVHKLQNLLVPKQEMTFEQVHDKLREESILSEKSFDYYWNCINDNVEIDEPGNILVVKKDRPVIPKFVAEWIDVHNLCGNNPLREYRDLEIDFNEGWTDEKDAEVYHWINKNPYAFIDSLRYGHEVEEEKK